MLCAVLPDLSIMSIMLHFSSVSTIVNLHCARALVLISSPEPNQCIALIHVESFLPH